MPYKALVIDDDESTLDLLKFQLESEKFAVTTAICGADGLAQVRDNEFDIILTDLNLPDISGFEMVKKSKEISPETEIIMITGDGSMEKAIQATKAGAFYYVEKPYEFEELFVLIGKAVERKQQAAEIFELRNKLSKRSVYEGIIGGSRAMENIFEIIDSVAESDANILILGESGTGKEVIANAIHYKSHRSRKPFVKVNCSALPKDLIESHLFGHVKGSFTGANSEKIGFIGQANGGSLLLDEIGEMPVDLQPKLLRVLQDKIYYRVGSDKPQEVDFRLISATNRNPFEAIQAGSLREDLYYRINTIEIKIPPLRDRMEDVPMLAEHFLKIYADKYARPEITFSQVAYDQMLNYNWRGNVRELQHAIERAVLLSKTPKILSLDVPKNMQSSISMADINKMAMPAGTSETISQVNGGQQFVAARDGSANYQTILIEEGASEAELFRNVAKLIVDKLPEPKDGEEQKDIFNELENVIVTAALKRTKGNKQAAANLLGLYRPRLYGMIKRHGIDDKS